MFWGVMSLNEPDVVGPANMDANSTADLYMNPWTKKGVKVSIVWNLKWMQTFLSAIMTQGGHVAYNMSLAPTFSIAYSGTRHTGMDPGRISPVSKNM